MEEITLLAITAAVIGLFHTLLGPDHYLPFIMMSRARKWSLSKTCLVTLFCGIGHIASSILIGFIGIIFGISLTKLVAIESVRGNIAAWLLIAFGLIYFLWGLQRAARNKPHKHRHIHEDGQTHIHRHTHTRTHMHIHEKQNNLTPWLLFTIFVFGPCEPLIPILMYPAATNSIHGLLIVTGIFSLVTITTMLAIVIPSSFGMKLINLSSMERYTHAMAGATILLCGLGIQFLGI